MLSLFKYLLSLRAESNGARQSQVLDCLVVPPRNDISCQLVRSLEAGAVEFI